MKHSGEHLAHTTALSYCPGCPTFQGNHDLPREPSVPGQHSVGLSSLGAAADLLYVLGVLQYFSSGEGSQAARGFLRQGGSFLPEQLARLDISVTAAGMNCIVQQVKRWLLAKMHTDFNAFTLTLLIKSATSKLCPFVEKTKTDFILISESSAYLLLNLAKDVYDLAFCTVSKSLI